MPTCQYCDTIYHAGECPECNELDPEPMDAAPYFDNLHDLFMALANWAKDREEPVEVPHPEDLECPRCGVRRRSVITLPTMPRCSCEGKFGYDLVAMRYPKRRLPHIDRISEPGGRNLRPKNEQKLTVCDFSDDM